VRWVVPLAALAAALSGCIAHPQPAAERALYLDLRKIVETNEDSGWIADGARLRANLEPALHSLCRTSDGAARALERWLETRLELQGGSALAVYRSHGRRLSAASEALSLERSLLLLRYAESERAQCPFWLEPEAAFAGQHSDAQRWVLLAESTGFASLVLKRWIPAIGGGGRLLLGRGFGPQLTAAIGAEAFASGAFISSDDHGFDATGSLAAPLLVRWSRLSRVIDLDVAPVLRFGSQRGAWPPGVRAELGAGISGLRGGAFMNYAMLYLGYELHFKSPHTPADNTIMIGTRFGTDWGP
jgi:hypothetical protein